MALLSLSIKRPSEFMEVPPSPPQSPPVVDAAFSPPSPAASSSDSPIDAGFLCLPLAPSAEGRAKKRRKQERPSFFVVDQSCARADVEDEDLQGSNGTEPTRDADDRLADAPLVWNDEVPPDDVVDPSPPMSAVKPDQDAAASGPPHPELSPSELHPAIRDPVSPVQSSSSSMPQSAAAVLPLYPSSPAMSRVKYPGGPGSDDGEGEGSDGGGTGVPETCPECRKVFKRRVYLQRHMAREHWSTAKVFKCDTCAYQTKHQSNLLVHRRTHTGERPYHCGACGQRYTQGHLLKAHIRSRHGAEMAYYNMDKRSDGVRCRRSLNGATTRLDPTAAAAASAAPGLKMNNPGLKEDKIWFLLEAAEAARGGAGAVGPRAPVPGPPPSAGPFAGMSLGQYVNALSSCLPGSSGMRPLLWTPSQAFQPPLPHDGVTSHAALLSSLAAAPLPSVQDPASQGVQGTSLLNSLLASYATGSPLFSINGLNGGTAAAGPGPTKAEQLSSSPLRCPSAEGAAVPQDLSMTGARDGTSNDSRREIASEPSFFPAAQVSASATQLGTTSSSRYSNSLPSATGLVETTQQTNLQVSIPADFKTSEHGSYDQWAAGSGTPANSKSEEQATDLSVRQPDPYDRTYPQSPPAPLGTVDLSSRGTDRKPRAPAIIREPEALQLQTDRKLAAKDKERCCDVAGCPHLRKLKQLRRNVYRMLSVFTPYMDVAGAGIADVEADSVDDFLHEVIYSSKLDAGHD